MNMRFTIACLVGVSAATATQNFGLDAPASPFGGSAGAFPGAPSSPFGGSAGAFGLGAATAYPGDKLHGFNPS